MRIRSVFRDAGLLLLATAVTAGAVVVVRDLRASADAQVPAQAKPPQQAAVLTAELAPASSGAVSAVELAAQELGWELSTVSVQGTGYTVAPPGQPTFSGLVESRLALSPDVDVVLVQGGGLDAAAPAGTLAAAVFGTLTRIQKRVPLSTRIVLVGPVAPPPGSEPVRAILEQAAARARVLYLDPVEQGWLTATTAPAAPTTGLTVDQQRQVGRRLAEELRGLGLARP